VAIAVGAIIRIGHSQHRTVAAAGTALSLSVIGGDTRCLQVAQRHGIVLVHLTDQMPIPRVACVPPFAGRRRGGHMIRRANRRIVRQRALEQGIAPMQAAFFSCFLQVLP
jgi:hypothetical protein